MRAVQSSGCAAPKLFASNLPIRALRRSRRQCEPCGERSPYADRKAISNCNDTAATIINPPISTMVAVDMSPSSVSSHLKAQFHVSLCSTKKCRSQYTTCTSGAGARAVFAVFVECVKGLELKLHVLRQRLLQLETEGKAVKTLAAIVVLAGDLEDQIAAVVVPERLIADRRTDIVVGKWIDLGEVVAEIGRGEKNARVGQRAANHRLASRLGEIADSQEGIEIDDVIGAVRMLGELRSEQDTVAYRVAGIAGEFILQGDGAVDPERGRNAVPGRNALDRRGAEVEARLRCCRPAHRSGRDCRC